MLPGSPAIDSGGRTSPNWLIAETMSPKPVPGNRDPAGAAKAVTDAGGRCSSTSSSVEDTTVVPSFPCADTRIGRPLSGSAQTSMWSIVDRLSDTFIRRPAAARPAIRSLGSRVTCCAVAWPSSRRARFAGHEVIGARQTAPPAAARRSRARRCSTRSPRSRCRPARGARRAHRWRRRVDAPVGAPSPPDAQRGRTAEQVGEREGPVSTGMDQAAGGLGVTGIGDVSRVLDTGQQGVRADRARSGREQPRSRTAARRARDADRQRDPSPMPAHASPYVDGPASVHRPGPATGA